MKCIIKRDGRVCDYDEGKISSAIFKAAKSVGGNNVVQSEELAEKVTAELDTKFNVSYPTVEDVQDMVERVLIDNGCAKTAKAYILFRANRTRVREMDTKLMHSYEDLTFMHSKDSDVKRENANINADTAMGTMLKYGSEGAKAFNCMYILDPQQATAHEQGDIHIHDLDFYTLTETCMTADTALIVKQNGKVKKVEASWFDAYFKGSKSEEESVDITALRILSRGAQFVDVLGAARRPITNQDVVYSIKAEGDIELKLTAEHVVPVLMSDTSTDAYNKHVKDIRADMYLMQDIEGEKTKLVKILSVEKIGYNGLVYDVKTADNYFNANGVIVHNCCQIGLKSLLKRGFSTGHGFLRTPASINSAAALACIAIQSNQNDQHRCNCIPCH